MALKSEGMRYLTAFFFWLLCSTPVLLAQQTDPDFMRSMGKMYVVVGVIAAIFLGLIVFMFTIEKRLTKLENQIKEHE